MIILSREAMKQVDQQCLDFYKMSSEHLMEIAGKTIADDIYHNLSDREKENCILIGCGLGNNGGDGFVIARWLHLYQLNCKIIAFEDPKTYTQECHSNYQRCKMLNIPIIFLSEAKKVEQSIQRNAIFIDAVYGISFHGVLKKGIRELFSLISNSLRTIYAIDIVSGVDANTGNADEYSLTADITYCIGANKIGYFFNEGKVKSGTLKFIDIGIPKNIIDEVKPVINLMTKDDVSYPKRNLESHKGSYGKIAIIAGSDSYTGAALLSSKACLKSGAGLIYLFHRSTLSNDYKGRIPEIICRPIAENSNLLPDKEQFIIDLKRMDCILIGPGITTDAYAQELVKICLEVAKDQAVIFDADAINIISNKESFKKQLKGLNAIITPHLLEYSRLKKKDIDEIESNIIVETQNFIKEYKIPILLKSSISFCCSNDRVNIIKKGNDGLSTGGSGDVLAGIIASFAGQYLCYEKSLNNSKINLKAILSKAAENAAYILGETAEYLNKIMETPAVTPSEIIQNLFKK